MFFKTEEEIYEKKYFNSIKNIDKFWKKQLNILDWIKKPEIISNYSFKKPVSIKWFEDSKLNVSYNCIDRHLKKKGDKTAIIWESDDLSISKKITYNQLHSKVSKLANILKKQGIKKRDIVIIYLPNIPEAIYSILACTRIGAIHSVVFSGFSAESLNKRIQDSNAKLLITANQSIRAGKITNLKQNVDDALLNIKSVKNVLVIKRTTEKVFMSKNRDLDYETEMKKISDNCNLSIQNGEDPLFILYTSGSTGTSKGIVHTTAGYLLYSTYTFKKVFNYKKNDIYWCTADVGWITGHSYLVYGPLSNGATIMMHEGTPFYPNAKVHFDLIDKYKINIYYTAPTAIRALIKQDDKILESSKRTSLKALGSVGEPLNSSAWTWYFEKIGKSKCNIVDTWWQTETGGIMFSPLIRSKIKKQTGVGKSILGTSPILFDENGKEVINSNQIGNLCFKTSWPGQARTIWNNHKRFEETYFSKFKGYYFSGDNAKFELTSQTFKVNEDIGIISKKNSLNKNFIISGRVDDIIITAGHNLSSAELENTLNKHKNIIESAVIGFPNEIKGEIIYAFLIIKREEKNINNFEKEIKQFISKKIGPIAKPSKIFIVEDLPKTRSGKIMRRLLRKITLGEKDLGDISTLLDIKVINEIKQLFN